MTGIKIKSKGDLTPAEQAAAARAIVYSMMNNEHRMTIYPKETFTVTEVSHDEEGNVVKNEEIYYSVLGLERDPTDNTVYIERTGGFQPW